MAEIECTIKEFHKFIGPRIRNMVQLMTKKRKKDQTLRYNFKGHDDRIRDIIQTDPRLQGLKRKK